MMAEAAAEYAGLELETRAGETVQLRNILMLPDDGLKAARVILGQFGETGAQELEELVPQIRDLLLLVADDATALKAEMTDWPLGVFVRTVGEWQEETQVGKLRARTADHRRPRRGAAGGPPTVLRPGPGRRVERHPRTPPSLATV
ncbi:hypothetical protein [Streptomyces sirii]|uniref:hypothetical protein n=1 Tax=Streptomyces sirii TaxID=3127701 RepID=UPI003D368726